MQKINREKVEPEQIEIKEDEVIAKGIAIVTSVAIIKGQQELASNLADFLNKGDELYVAGLYHTCDAASKGLLENPVDTAIIDIQVDNCQGIELIAKLSNQTPNTKYPVFTLQNEDGTIFNALRAGANGYILRDTPFEKTKEALHELMCGGAPMSSFVASKVLNYFHPRKKIFNIHSLLSDREKEILHFAS